MSKRPAFIVSSADVLERIHRYPKSDEDMAPSRPVGRAAGLLQIGIHLVRVPPGRRTSYPHAESAEEEFVYVIEGEIDAWIDGELHRMKAGDFAAFPSGTGICHMFINDADRDALLLSGGEADKAGSRIYYPLNPERRDDMPWSRWWDDVPKRPQGSHDGRPRAPAALRATVPGSRQSEPMRRHTRGMGYLRDNPVFHHVLLLERDDAFASDFDEAANRVRKAYLGEPLATDDVAVWTAAARAPGELQRECIDAVAELQALGCEVTLATTLVEPLSALLADADALLDAVREAYLQGWSSSGSGVGASVHAPLGGTVGRLDPVGSVHVTLRRRCRAGEGGRVQDVSLRGSWRCGRPA